MYVCMSERVMMSDATLQALSHKACSVHVMFNTLAWVQKVPLCIC